MKTRNYLTPLAWVMLTFSAWAQPSAQTGFSDKKEYSSESFTFKKHVTTVKDGFITKTFEINVSKEGDYYLNSWLSGAGSTGENQIEVRFNGEETAKKMKVAKNNFHTALLSGSDHKKYRFGKGLNKITFTCKEPVIPPVEFICLSVSENSLSDKGYTDYILQLKNNKNAPGYGQQKKKALAADKKKSLARVLNNPEGDYKHEIDFNFTYTYYTYLYLYAGQPVTFETTNSTVDPIIHLFNYDNPDGIDSWSDDDGGEGLNSRLTCTPANSGTYLLLVRRYIYSGSQPGTANLYKDGSLFASNIAVAGNEIICSVPPSGTKNYFTSHRAGDPRIWVEASAPTGKIVGFNDDYYGDGDFNWGTNARVKKDFTTNIKSVIVSSYSSYIPYGICDVYMGCDQSFAGNIGPSSLFPFLKDDDVIKTAPVNYLYNCASWAGGRVDLGPQFAPHQQATPSNLNQWYHPNPLTAFDNYFSNNPPRYAGALHYTRSGADAHNGQIALWGNAEDGFLHVSVKKGANDMPHGYDWESKPGGYSQRIMHPRDALTGPAYGSINTYYRPTGGHTRMARSLTFNESVEQGLTVLDTEELTAKETKKLTSLTDRVPLAIATEFNTKYDAWKAAASKPEMRIHSFITPFLELKEYKDLVAYSKDQNKVLLPLLIKKVEDGDELAQSPLAALTTTEYGKTMIAIREESIKRSKESYAEYENTGTPYVAPSIKANWTRFNKELLKTLDTPEGQGDLSEVTLSPNYPNPFSSGTAIRFSLAGKATVSLKVFNVQGQEIVSLLTDVVMDKGWQSIAWDGKDQNGNEVRKGIYTYTLIADDVLYSGKLLKVE